MNSVKLRLSSAAVTAAFIGPGTILTCSLAGIRFGHELLWVLPVSLAVLVVAQDACIRLGAVGNLSLAEAVRTEVPSRWLRAALALLVVCAIGVGSAAYQAGNLKGAAQGMLVLFQIPERVAFVVIAALALGLLSIANITLLLRVLVALVLLMTGCFIAAAVISKPDWDSLAEGLFLPSVPAIDPRDAFVLIAGLVGTTIVPYNLFLHSALAKRYSADPAALRNERLSLLLFLPLGALVSMLIVVTAAAAFHGGAAPPAKLAEMGTQLQPALGRFGVWIFGLGLLAAGLSSALTAPFAAGLALSQLRQDRSPGTRRAVALAVMLVGIGAGFLSNSPTKIIQFAQVTNALLLPVSLGLLFWITTRSPRLAHARAGLFGTIFGIGSFLISIVLSIRTAVLLIP